MTLASNILKLKRDIIVYGDYLFVVSGGGFLRRPGTEIARVRVERKVRDKKEERERGTAEGKQKAPALLDVKPQSCLWLILPDSGGGALRHVVKLKLNCKTQYDYRV